MLQKTAAYIKKQNMVKPGKKVVLGLSGGLDSVCLFHLLRELGYELEVVHVNHGIRGDEAKRDEMFVKTLCERFHIPVHVFYYDVPEISKEKHLSVEEAGRLMRRQAFEEVLGKTKAEAVALAHHCNDRAETFLFHLSRGTGMKGLASIRPAEGIYIRPILWATRQEIEGYVQKQNYAYVEDSTNAADDYTRNKIRHQVIPLLEEINEKSVAHICGAAEKLSAAAAYMEREAEKLYRLSVVTAEKEASVLKTAFSQGDEVLQIPVLQKCVEYLTGSLANITEEHWKRLQQLFEMQTGKEVQLPYGIRAVRTYEGICIFRREEKVQRQPVEIKGEGSYTFDGETVQISVENWDEKKNIPTKNYTKYFDYDKITQTVYLRNREAGDYLEINRNHGKKSLQDYLVNEKIPREKRDQVIVLADGSHILWVVGKRISEYYKVTKETKKVLKVQVYGGNIYE